MREIVPDNWNRLVHVHVGLYWYMYTLDLIQVINVKAVQELILWSRLDHAVNKIYKLSALMTYIYQLSLLLLLYYMF